MQREPKHARGDQNPLLRALPMSRPLVRGAGREGWQTLVLALRGDARGGEDHTHTHIAGKHTHTNSRTYRMFGGGHNK